MRPFRSKPKKERHPAVELVLVVAVALGMALVIQAFLVKPYKIPSQSMVPTLVEHQRVLVNRLGMRFSDPDVGDVTVFHPPAGALLGGGKACGVEPPEGSPCPRPTPERAGRKTNFVKRIVAGPGDTLAIEDGHVIRNGKRVREPYMRPCESGELCDFPKAIKIPKGYYFMMGDNRGQSDDSRFWGPVPRKWIIGQAFATYWPPNRLGLL
jgi:signal peptidase I